MKTQKKLYCKPRCNASYIIAENWINDSLPCEESKRILATVDLNPKKRWAWEQEDETETGMRIKVRCGCLTLFLSVEEFDRIFQCEEAQKGL